VVFCGDLNVAHTRSILANPKSNRRNAGFTDEERANFSGLLARGFTDTFREFEKAPGTTRGGARWATAARVTSGGASIISSPAKSCAPPQARLDQPRGDVGATIARWDLN